MKGWSSLLQRHASTLLSTQNSVPLP